MLCTLSDILIGRFFVPSPIDRSVTISSHSVTLPVPEEDECDTQTQVQQLDHKSRWELEQIINQLIELMTADG